MKKITLILIFSAVIVLLVAFFIRQNIRKPVEIAIVSKTTTQDAKVDEPSEVKEIKAAFMIFTNGTKRDFSALMYHNLSPDVYISAQNPNIITATKERITWQEFFDTLPFELKKECLTTGTKQTFCTGKSGVLKFYLNGGRDDDLLVRTINDGDKALVTFGPEEEPNLEFQLSQIPDPV